MKHKDYWSYLVIATICGLFVFLFSRSSSPLYLSIQIDQQIFQYMGFSMTKGVIPYADLFDHKGLLLYVYNALGYLIGGRIGVLFFQWFNLSSSCFFLYNGLSFIKSVYCRYMLLILGLICLLVFYFDGNLTEEWSLPFICYPLAVFYKKVFSKGEVIFSKRELVNIGLCLGTISLIRVNNVAPVLGILVYSLYTAINSKYWTYIGKSFSVILLGSLCPILIASIYMIYIDGVQGLMDLYYGSIGFNIDYAVNHVPTEDVSLINKVRFYYRVFVPLFFVLPMLKTRPHIVVPLFFCYCITLLSVGKMLFSHYLQIFIPLMIISMALILILKKSVLFKIFAILISIAPCVRLDIQEWRPIPNHFVTEDSYEDFREMISVVPQSERDDIWNYNNPYLIYPFMSMGIIQSNRVFLPFQLDISQGLESEFNGIIKKRPAYILYSFHTYDVMIDLCSYSGEKEDIEFMQTNYEPVSEMIHYGTKVVCYRRKDLSS